MSSKQNKFSQVTGAFARFAGEMALHIFLQKYPVFRPPREILLQHRHVGQKSRIVKVLCSPAADAHARLAFDTDPCNFFRFLPADGPHGAHAGAVPASAAPVMVCLRLCF